MPQQASDLPYLSDLQSALQDTGSLNRPGSVVSVNRATDTNPLGNGVTDRKFSVLFHPQGTTSGIGQDVDTTNGTPVACYLRYQNGPPSYVVRPVYPTKTRFGGLSGPVPDDSQPAIQIGIQVLQNNSRATREQHEQDLTAILLAASVAGTGETPSAPLSWTGLLSGEIGPGSAFSAALNQKLGHDWSVSSASRFLF